MLVKYAAGTERNSHGCKIVGADIAAIRFVLVLRLARMSFHYEARGTAIAGQRDCARSCDRLNARQRFQPRTQTLFNRDRLLPGLVLLLGKHSLERQQACRGETWIHMKELVQALQQKSRRYQQD